VSRDREPGAGTATVTPPVSTRLLALADRARLNGDDAAAAAILERFLREQPRAETSAAAAFTLARLRREKLRDPIGAARAFRQAIALGVPAALAEDALAYLALAEAESQAPSRARAAAADYLDRFPHGRHAEAMRSLVAAR
jgi:hypothetical protein